LPAIVLAGCTSLPGPTRTASPSASNPSAQPNSEAAETAPANGASESAEHAAANDRTQPVGPMPMPDPAHNVFFDLNSADLDDQARATIKPIAESLKGNRTRSVVLVGHTNDQNNTEFGLALAARRAAAVEQEMLRLGVAPGQISKRPIGHEMLVSGRCNTGACLHATRRVEIQVVE